MSATTKRHGPLSVLTAGSACRRSDSTLHAHTSSGQDKTLSPTSGSRLLHYRRQERTFAGALWQFRRAIMRLVISSPPEPLDFRSVRHAYDTVAEDYAARFPDTRAEAPLDLAT